MDDERLARLLAAEEIRNIYYRYCRGIDRRQYDLVRSCYHPDAFDNHGEYVGGLDGFIDHVRSNLPRFERTMHFLGNIMIDVDDDKARGEAYALAHHRLAARGSKPERDFVVGLRYVDDFECRAGNWGIAHRVCVFEWTRMDPVGESPYRFGEAHLRGRTGGDDPVFAPSLADLRQGKGTP